MLENSDDSTNISKGILTSKQTVNRTFNIKASNGVTIKLNKILVNLQPPSVTKMEASTQIKSANNSLCQSFLLNKSRKSLAHKKSVLELPSFNKDVTKVGELSPKKPVKKSHVRSLSNGHLRPIDKPVPRDSPSFVKFIGTPLPIRSEKNSAPVQPKIKKLGDIRVSPDEKSSKGRMTPDSFSKTSLRHLRQKSLLEIKPEILKGESISSISRIEKRITSRKNRTGSIENSGFQSLISSEFMKWRPLIFSPNVEEEVLKKHIKMVSEGVNYALNNLRPPSLAYVESRQVILETRKKNHKKTLILDLDETLITSCLLEDKPDLVLTPREGITDMKVIIKVRPFAMQFLNIMKEYFEIIVFTASSELYAKTIVKALDPKAECISFLFHRAYCFETNKGLRIKDLRIFKNRELKDMVIVDNFVPAFSFQLDNGIPILEWRGNKSDRELMHLVGYLLEAKEYDDMRVYNKEKLNILSLANNTNLLEELAP